MAVSQVRAGRCYRLYSKGFFDAKMAPYELAEMLRSSVTSLVLQLKTLNIEGHAEEVCLVVTKGFTSYCSKGVTSYFQGDY